MKIRKNSLLSGLAGVFAGTLFCSASAFSATTISAEDAIKQTRTHFHTLLERKPGFYPQCKAAAIRPRQENFQKKHLTLSGLKVVHLDVDGLLKSADKKNTTLIKDLKKQVAKRLAKGGLRLITKEEMIRTPGQPEMNIYMSFPPHMTPAKKGKKPVPYRPECCAMSTWGAFSQAAQIMRDPETNYKLGTWGKGYNTADCSNPAGWMSKAILDTVDQFVADKLKGDKDYASWLKKRGKRPKAVQTQNKKPKQLAKRRSGTKHQKPRQQTHQSIKKKTQVQRATVQPKKYQQPTTHTKTPKISANCNGAVRTYIDLFAANEILLDPANYHVLDLLAKNMLSCPMYSYVIETHADLRSSSEHNERLSALRAASIQGHLLARGVKKKQFIVQSFGEINPVSRGNRSIDHTANRRVVVRPYLRH